MFLLMETIMKLDTKMIFSTLLGASIVFLIMSTNNAEIDFITKVNASEVKATKIDAGTLTNCEVFFKDDRDSFEEEINSRLKNVKLLQSNVLWSETTKQFGFYALICY